MVRNIPKALSNSIVGTVSDSININGKAKLSRLSYLVGNHRYNKASFGI